MNNIFIDQQKRISLCTLLCGFFFKLNHALQPIHRCDTIEEPDSYSDKNYKLRLSILNMDQNSINVYDVSGDKVTLFQSPSSIFWNRCDQLYCHQHHRHWYYFDAYLELKVSVCNFYPYNYQASQLYHTYELVGAHDSV